MIDDGVWDKVIGFVSNRICFCVSPCHHCGKANFTLLDIVNIIPANVMRLLLGARLD